MTCAIIYQNYALQGSFGGPAWSASAPLANLKEQDIGLVAVSASAAPADTQFTVDLGIIPPIGGIVIGPVNLAANDEVRVQSFASSAMTVAALDETRTITGDLVDWSNTADWLPWRHPRFWRGVKSEEETEGLPLYVPITIPVADAAKGSARYWKISFTRAGAGGPVRLGGLFMGRILRPSLNYSYGAELGFNQLVDVVETLGGKRDFWHRGMRRKQRVAFENLPEAEVFGSWYRLALRTRRDRTVFWIPEEGDDAVTMRKRAFLAHLNELPAIAQVVVERASLALDLEEVA